jgi:hypothetical protein
MIGSSTWILIPESRRDEESQMFRTSEERSSRGSEQATGACRRTAASCGPSKAKPTRSAPWR